MGVETVLASGPGQPPALAERRLVTVLFADLVGFTTLSEHRDPEEVRKLLSEYFERSRGLIGRYGGTVEKFIGDAVMAVWGTPVTLEDDAERAVRAGLDLVAAVAALGEELGMPGLQVRAGVVTGEVAVRLGAEQEGMVMGDAVNTAARIQTAAGPGTVLVDDRTHGASDAAVIFEEAGLLQLKGRTEPVRAWRAMRVVANVGGQSRASGLEPPFVGRRRELRTIIERFEDVLADGQARLVAVTGPAGMGKSRLGWEFEKYADGLAGTVLWHRGRCLSYGEGVGFWALADMVRGRAGITEDDGGAEAFDRLRSTVETFVSDPGEQRLVLPRLAHLLGMEQRAAGERADLFAGWRLFFERLADHAPVALVIEDVHRADSGLLDFIDYLLEWSAGHPIFILTLARPEIAERAPHWPASRNNVVGVALQALAHERMSELLQGLVTGMPPELVQRILERSEGVPLYATETVRMLVDRGALREAGTRYEVVHVVEDLELPATLHALVASRLDGLSPSERSLLQDASVLGQVFGVEALAAVSGKPAAEVQRRLDGLVAKQVLSLDVAERSPERGQYAFLQAVMRRVAYGTLARDDRKTRHLAAARALTGTWGEQAGEIASLLAAHYLDAIQADPAAADVAEIRSLALETLVTAGRRSASLASGEDAERFFATAAEFAGGPLQQALLLEEAGQAADLTNHRERARELYHRSIVLLEEVGNRRDAARVKGRVGATLLPPAAPPEAARALLEAAYAELADKPDQDFALVANILARCVQGTAEEKPTLEYCDRSLEVAERLGLTALIGEGLATKAGALAALGRLHEAHALAEHALKLLDEGGRESAAPRAANNLAWLLLLGGDRYAEALEHMRRGAEAAYRLGDAGWELFLRGAQPYPLYLLGRWDEATELEGSLAGHEDDPVMWADVLGATLRIAAGRGRLDAGRRAEHKRMEKAEDDYASDAQWLEPFVANRALLLRADGRPDEALRAVQAVLQTSPAGGIPTYYRYELIVEALEAALELGRLEVADDILGDVSQAPSRPVLRAHAARFRARIASARSGPEAGLPDARQAAEHFEALGLPFHLAITQLEQAEALAELGRGEEARGLLRRARSTFTRLEAAPWVARADAAMPDAAAPLHTAG